MKTKEYLERQKLYFASLDLNYHRIRESITRMESYGRLCREEERKKILAMIEKERDEGNVMPKGFSAGICISNLLGYLKRSEDGKKRNINKRREWK